jgi:hypothetical protein
MRAKSTAATPMCIRLRPSHFTVIRRQAVSPTQNIDLQPPAKSTDKTGYSQLARRLTKPYESSKVDCIPIRTRQISKKSVMSIAGSMLQSAANYSENCQPDQAPTASSMAFKGPLHKELCFEVDRCRDLSHFSKRVLK